MISQVAKVEMVDLAVRTNKEVVIIGNLITPKDVQDRLNIGKNTTYKLFHLKGFPKIKIGKKYFVYEDDLDRYLKQHVTSTIYLE